jgi:hypothetical protein
MANISMSLPEYGRRYQEARHQDCRQQQKQEPAKAFDQSSHSSWETPTSFL